jgi:hypothetical protein
LAAKSVCPDCYGHGELCVEGKCSDCSGAGCVNCYRGTIIHYIECSTCEGVGIVDYMKGIEDVSTVQSLRG